MVTLPSTAKTAEPIEMPIEVWTPLGRGNHVLEGGTYGRYLTSIIERSVLGGNTGYRYTITVATYLEPASCGHVHLNSKYLRPRRPN